MHKKRTEPIRISTSLKQIIDEIKKSFKENGFEISDAKASDYLAQKLNKRIGELDAKNMWKRIKDIDIK